MKNIINLLVILLFANKILAVRVGYTTYGETIDDIMEPCTGAQYSIRDFFDFSKFEIKRKNEEQVEIVGEVRYKGGLPRDEVIEFKVENYKKNGGQYVKTPYTFLFPDFVTEFYNSNGKFWTIGQYFVTDDNKFPPEDDYIYKIDKPGVMSQVFDIADGSDADGEYLSILTFNLRSGSMCAQARGNVFIV